MEVLRNFSKITESFKKLYSTVDERILNLEGISEKQLDISYMASKYFSEQVLDISIDDNYFELGGDSLLATKIITEINKDMLASFSINDIFKYPSIRKMSREIDNKFKVEHVDLSYNSDEIKTVKQDEYITLIEPTVKGGNSTTYVLFHIGTGDILAYNDMISMLHQRK